MYTKDIAGNKKAYHDYEIKEKIECGIELKGTEVKSAKNNGASIKEAYVKIIQGEVYVVGMNIKPYEFGSYNNSDPLRDRKLLMHKREIKKLKEEIQLSGMTLVPLRLYIKGGLIKMGFNSL